MTENLVRTIAARCSCNGGNHHRWSPMALSVRGHMRESDVIDAIVAPAPRTALEAAVATRTGYKVHITISRCRTWVHVRADRCSIDDW